MPYFSILKEKPGDDFQVVACHINLWSLSASYRRRVFVLDVGVRLRGGDKEVSKICLALPVGTFDKDMGGINDLYKELQDKTVAELVFGKPVQISGENSIITYKPGPGEPEVKLEPISFVENDTELDGGYSSEDYSYWKIGLSKPLSKETENYLRVRFRVSNAKRVWSWKPYRISSNGALVDFRVSDIRGSYVEKRDWGTFTSRIAEIPMLNFFVIVPDWLQLRAASPAYHYMRVFEGRIWEKYLKRRVDLKRREKLVIYQWHNDATKPAIGSNNPFRVFLDLSKEFGLYSYLNHLIAAMLVVFLAGVVSVFVMLYPLYGGYVEGAPPRAWGIIDTLWKKLVAGGIVAAIIVVAGYLTKANSGVKKIKEWRGKFRRWFLKREWRKYGRDLSD